MGGTTTLLSGVCLINSNNFATSVALSEDGGMRSNDCHSSYDCCAFLHVL